MEFKSSPTSYWDLVKLIKYDLLCLMNLLLQLGSDLTLNIFY